MAFLADLLPPASSAKRKALLHHQFPKVVVLTAVWLCRKHHCLRHLAFTFFFFFFFPFFLSSLFFFSLMCCRNSLSTPFTSREHLGCSDHLPEHHSACTLCTGSAFADPTNVSIPKDRKKPEDTPQSTSWQEVSRTCTMSSCATGSLSSARQPWGAASGRTLG